MAKKLVDTWKTKKWYAIRAPKIFNEVEVSEVPAQDEAHLLNRVIEIPLKDITKDIAHIYASVRLRVSEVKGNTAHTKFIGHSLSREYLATLVRRYRDKLDVVLPLKSKDGVHFTVKAVVVTQDRISGRQRKALHSAFADLVKARARETDFAPLVLDMIYNKLSQELHAKLHKLAPIRRVEMRKTVLTEWFDTETNMPLPAPPAPEPEQPMESPVPAAEPAPAMGEAPAESPAA
jgi:small subunit ribosomal protein S3Ae